MHLSIRHGHSLLVPDDSFQGEYREQGKIEVMRGGFLIHEDHFQVIFKPCLCASPQRVAHPFKVSLLLCQNLIGSECNMILQVETFIIGHENPFMTSFPIGNTDSCI